MQIPDENGKIHPLRAARLQRHWTQREVAERVGTTTTTVKRWERQAAVPGPYFRLKLTALFDKSEEELGLGKGVNQSSIPFSAGEPSEGEPTSFSSPDTPTLEAIPFASSEREPSQEMQTRHFPPDGPLLGTGSYQEEGVSQTQDPSSPVRKGRVHLFPPLSRRAVLVGLGIIISGSVVGGSVAFLRPSQRTPMPSPVATSKGTSLPQGTRFFTYKGHSSDVNAVDWSPNGTLIASASDDSTVQVWDSEDGSHVFTYRRHASFVEAVAWSPSGQRIISGSADHSSQIWDATNGGNVIINEYSGWVFAVAWSPDGTRIVSGNGDGTVQVVHTMNGSSAFTYRGHSAKVYAVAWSPDGTRIASGGNDNTVQVWNAADGSHVFTYRKHSAKVNAVIWSPDSARIASGSNDGTVQVWNAMDGSHVFTYHGHSSYYVDALAWSPNGTHIASASTDQTVQVWNAVDGSYPFTYQGHSSNVYAVVWSPDGQRIASGSQDKTVHVWQAL